MIEREHHKTVNPDAIVFRWTMALGAAALIIAWIAG
jgi:hypothetical protein